MNEKSQLPRSQSQEEFLSRELLHRRRVKITRVMLTVLLLALWELSASMDWIDSFIFSSPSRIFLCLGTMIRDGSLFLHTGVTLLETLISFFAVVFFGLVAALLLWSFRSLAEILEPFLVMLNSLPKSALAPLLIVWLGNNMNTIIVAAVSVALFGSILTLYTGFASLDQDQIKLIYSLGGTKKDVLWLPAHDHQQYEGEYRALSGGGYHRRVPLLQGRAGVSDYLWVADLCHDHGRYLHCGPVPSVRDSLSGYRFGGEAAEVGSCRKIVKSTQRPFFGRLCAIHIK